MEVWFLAVVVFELVILLFIELNNSNSNRRFDRILSSIHELTVQLSFIAGRIGLQRSDFRVPPVVGPSEELKTDVIGGDQWDTTEEDAERLAEEAESGRHTRPENQ